MTPAQIQTLIDACRTSPTDLVTWLELKAVLEGLKNQDLGLTLTTTGTSGPATLDIDTDILNIPNYSTDLTVYVPYTGANQNVNLGEYGIRSGWYQLDLTPTGTPTSASTMYWDDNQKTVALVMGGTTQEIGHDQFYHAKNSTGTTIPKGTAVRFAGTDGGSGHLLITPFLADGSNPSSYFMGVTAEAITNGSFGKVQSFGRLDGVDTSAFNEGDILYASTTVAGGFQTTVPQAPNNIILVAAVVSDAVNGKILIRPTLGSKLSLDESVRISSPTNGQVLQYNSSLAVWQNVNASSLSVNNIYTADGTLTGNRTVTMGGRTLTFLENANLNARILVKNDATSGTSAEASLTAQSNSGVSTIGRFSLTATAYKIISAGDAYVYSSDKQLAILADNSVGQIKFAGGGSSTAHMTLFNTGNLGINTTTDAGFRLDVSGNIRTTTELIAGTNATGGVRIGATSGSGSFLIRGYADTTNPGIEKVAANNTAMEFYNRGQGSNAYVWRYSCTDTNARPMNVGASGSADVLQILTGLGAPNAANITGNVLSLRPVINQTGSGQTTTIINGILYAPTLTDLTGVSQHNFIRASVGNILVCTSSGYMGIGATADTAYKLSVDGDLRVYGNIRTAQPTGGTGTGVWRLGSTATGTFTMSTTVCVEIEIGGTLYKLATVN